MPRTARKPPRTGRPYLDTVLVQPGSVLAMAHRGGAAVGRPGLENTLAAFRYAVALGYDYLETDVHTTRDGVLVAFHDEVLDRVTDGHGELATSTWDEVSRVRIGGTEPVPTMAALLEELPQARFNIDLKSAEAGPVLARLLDRTGAEERVCVGAFEQTRMREFRRITEGRVATAATPAEAVLAKAAPTSVVRRTLGRAGGPSVLQVPVRRGPVRVVTRGLVERCHAAGLHLHVWTVDDPEEIAELVDLGVDGIFTDRAEVLHDVLLDRGAWSEPHR